MSRRPGQDDERLAAYKAAVGRLPVLTRTVFLMHRVDNLSFNKISGRLGISIVAVECLITEALIMMYRTLEGQTPRRQKNVHIAAEASLRRRYHSHCEGALRTLGIAGPFPWNDAHDDRDAIVQVILTTMPLPIRDTFVLHRIERLTYAQIAKHTGTLQWIVRYRMLRAIRSVARAPESFEQWLLESDHFLQM